VSLPPCRVAACLLALLYGAAAAHAGGPLVDPTRPSATVAPRDDGAIRVQAIILRTAVHVAIVDGRPVRAGDRIGDALIEEVTAEGVRYLRNGRSGFARLSVVNIAVRRSATDGNRVP
jgi:hypothetical protein